MKIKEYKDTEGNLFIKAIEPETDLEKKVIELALQYVYAYECTLYEDTKNFVGRIVLKIDDSGEISPTFFHMPKEMVEKSNDSKTTNQSS